MAFQPSILLPVLYYFRTEGTPKYNVNGTGLYLAPSPIFRSLVPVLQWIIICESLLAFYFLTSPYRSTNTAIPNKTVTYVNNKIRGYALLYVRTVQRKHKLPRILTCRQLDDCVVAGGQVLRTTAHLDILVLRLQQVDLVEGPVPRLLQAQQLCRS